MKIDYIKIKIWIKTRTISQWYLMLGQGCQYNKTKTKKKKELNVN